MDISTIIGLLVVTALAVALLWTPEGRRSVVKPEYSGADFMAWIVAISAVRYVFGSLENASTGTTVLAFLVAAAIVVPITFVCYRYERRWWTVSRRSEPEPESGDAPKGGPYR